MARSLWGEGRSALARVLSVEDARGFSLPGAQEFLHVAVVRDGLAQYLGMLGRDVSVHQLALLHVTPLVVRPVPRRGVGPTGTAELAAFHHSLQSRARTHVVDFGNAASGAPRVRMVVVPIEL